MCSQAAQTKNEPVTCLMLFYNNDSSTAAWCGMQQAHVLKHFVFKLWLTFWSFEEVKVFLKDGQVCRNTTAETNHVYLCTFVCKPVQDTDASHGLWAADGQSGRFPVFALSLDMQERRTCVWGSWGHCWPAATTNHCLKRPCVAVCVNMRKTF